ncbi:NADH-quinone oxidoreductase subunit NuoE [Actinomadura viridis]|uniref:NADH-quinone oxidoreductase subunit E n=1 Tax=Actinomadura viridis TaxID=58110 RepID=A0A931DEV5_9ACTN|nr:NADH-quinone oxidoreductase subunit NuoE [Actinomadura viridis]MBG6086281.1 NADH-quinone oxidoreductase subunit E [Actinomadura viridis]
MTTPEGGREAGTAVFVTLEAPGGGESVESVEEYEPAERERLERDAKEIIARYPKPRSALLPMLHLVQSADGYVSRRGIEFCAEQLGITPAQVTGVATFYTMYKRAPVGEYHVGVCINTLCAIMGGDQIWSELSEHLGVGHDEATPDGTVSLERIECNAACDFAPVMTVNWEFFDNMTPEKAKALVDDLRQGKQVVPSRGPSGLCSWKDASRVLAGFPDGRANEGLQAGPESLVGLKLAKERGWEAPAADADRPQPHEPVRPGEITPPPVEPGKPVGGEAKPGTQEGRNQ